MRGFLGVPVQTSSHRYGFIYVADKLSDAAFSQEDVRFLTTIAAKLAVAYESALRHLEIQERTATLEFEVAQRKQAEERFRLLVETAPTGILICDAQGRITEANAQLQKMFGYGRQELVGQAIEILVPEQHRGSHEGRRSAYTKSPQTRPMGVGMELRGRRKDGTTFPLEISLGPLLTSEGTWISSTIVDISERKKLEQQLQVSQRLEAVGQLAAGIAHDFNNILTAITGNAKLALETIAPHEPAHSSLMEIEKASLRATQLVRQILTFGRQEAPKRHTHPNGNWQQHATNEDDQGNVKRGKQLGEIHQHTHAGLPYGVRNRRTNADWRKQHYDIARCLRRFHANPSDHDEPRHQCCRGNGEKIRGLIGD